jgi:hypothetical protein
MGYKKMRKKIFCLMLTSIFLLTVFSSVSGLNAEKNDIYQNNEESGENFAIILVGTHYIDVFGLLDDLNYNFYRDGRIIYHALLNAGFDDDHIQYLDKFLTVNKYFEDYIDHRGMDGISSYKNIKNSITDWLKSRSNENSNVFIFLIDHGDPDGNFYPASNQEPVSGYDLNQWLEGVEYNTLSIICEFCFSGAFINHLSKEKRIILTSTDKNHTAYANFDSFKGSHFIYSLIEGLRDGKSLLKAWEAADYEMFWDKSCPNTQNPQIDDNGDGIGYGFNSSADVLNPQNESDEGWLASQTYLVGSNPGNNYAPSKPNLIKVYNGYRAISEDPEEDRIYYLFQWKNGTYSEWIGSYGSGAFCFVEEKPKRVKAKDVHGAEGEWTTILVNNNEKMISKSLSLIEKLAIIFPFFYKIIQRLTNP